MFRQAWSVWGSEGLLYVPAGLVCLGMVPSVWLGGEALSCVCAIGGEETCCQDIG